LAIRPPLAVIRSAAAFAPPAIGATVYGGQPVAAMEAEAALTVACDRALLDRFVTLFPLPPKV
jgi:hypothetical protein